MNDQPADSIEPVKFRVYSLPPATGENHKVRMYVETDGQSLCGQEITNETDHETIP